MKTHTIKSGGDDGQLRIVTLTDQFIALLKTAKTDLAVRCTIEDMLRRLKSLTGKRHVINSSQETELNEFVATVSSPSDGYLKLHAHQLVMDGVKARAMMAPEELFEILDATFYAIKNHTWAR